METRDETRIERHARPVLSLPTRNGNPESVFWPVPAATGSEPTYEEWKLRSFTHACAAWCVFSLPTRNGNPAPPSRLHPRGPLLQPTYEEWKPDEEVEAIVQVIVFSLPTRNGNRLKRSLVSSRPGVFSLPTRNGNYVRQTAIPDKGKGLQPTYEEWKRRYGLRHGPEVGRLQPTYEEWKPRLQIAA